MIGFIIVCIIIYSLIGFFVAIFHSPTISHYHVDYPAQSNRAVSMGIFWIVYLLRWICRTLVTAFVILIKS